MNTSTKTHEKQQELSMLKERLLDIEYEQSSGAKSYSLEELESSLRKVLEQSK